MEPQAKNSPHIFVLDADPAILEYVRRILADRFRVSLFRGPAELNRSLKESSSPDLILMDWYLAEDGSGENVLSLLARIRAFRPALPIVLLACSAELKQVQLATRMGAVDIVPKPFTRTDIESAVQECLKQARSNDDTSDVPLDESTSFVRSSKCMRDIESQCALVARTDIPVLILGESGTGKEVAASLIHQMSVRKRRPFLKVNCAAMPAELLESELFGYEQGAFTGAINSKPGQFEVCNHGTILLDEIGEIPYALQAKLLQVLQDGTFSRLGSRSTVQVDVRVIAATNIVMKTAIAQKLFRHDLYYRLNGFTITMPPLRERRDEIALLSDHFMRKFAAQYGREPLLLSPELMQALKSHSWPGNVRELENTIKRYLVLGDEQDVIDELSPVQRSVLYVLEDGSRGNRSLKHIVHDLKGSTESTAIAQSLQNTGWNRRTAADDLQISYKALLNKIKQYNLRPPRKTPVLIDGATDLHHARIA
jgi:two-component system, NtrC family, response regulator AtoC